MASTEAVILEVLERLPRPYPAKLPTPLAPPWRLGRELGPEPWLKRDGPNGMPNIEPERASRHFSRGKANG